MSDDKTVAFVCLHGMGTSRLAAAYFNHVAPTGWRAVSAGLAPGAALSPTAARLLEGTSAEPFLDRAAPRNPTWGLHSAEFDEPMREAIRDRVDALATSLGGRLGASG